MTPLHWAVANNSQGCIKLLVEAGCDLSLKNDRDHTPIDTARTLKRRVRDEVIDIIEMARRAAVKNGKSTTAATATITGDQTALNGTHTTPSTAYFLPLNNEIARSLFASPQCHNSNTLDLLVFVNYGD